VELEALKKPEAAEAQKSKEKKVASKRPPEATPKGVNPKERESAGVKTRQKVSRAKA
jgi:hypothetical protein